MKVYHGTSKANADSILKNGFHHGTGGISNQADNDFVFVSPHKASAEYFAKNNTKHNSPTVIEAELSGKLLPTQGKIADFEALGQAHKLLNVPLQGTNKTMLNIDALKSALKKNGYVGVSFKDIYSSGRESYAISDKSALKLSSPMQAGATKLRQNLASKNNWGKWDADHKK